MFENIIVQERTMRPQLGSVGLCSLFLVAVAPKFLALSIKTEEKERKCSICFRCYREQGR